MLISTVLMLILSTLSLCMVAQGSYNMILTGPEDSNFEQIYFDNYDGFIAVYEEYLAQNSQLTKSRIYSLSNTSVFDTVDWGINLFRGDTALSICYISREENHEYFIIGFGVSLDSNYNVLSRFDWSMKVDECHNTLWEKTYQWPDIGTNFQSSSWIRVLKLDSDEYMLARTLSNYIPQPNTTMQLIKINCVGDSITSKLYESYTSGFIHDITYNHDSTKYMIHNGAGGIPDCGGGCGAYFVDIDSFEIESSMCYALGSPNFDDIRLPFNVKWNSNDELIVSGRGTFYNGVSSSKHLATWKYDTNYQVIKKSYLIHPDTLIYGAWKQCIDINAEGEICVSGSFDNATGIFPSKYSWAYVAKLDEDLNIIQEQYFGGDASYDVYSIVATSDGGIAIGGYKYDYLTNEPNEGDAFVIKTDAGLFVDVQNQTEIPIHSAVIYPNPGGNYLSLRTSQKEALFRLYNSVGELVLIKPINTLITNYNTVDLPLGIYLWTLSKRNEQIIDSGKWIKI